MINALPYLGPMLPSAFAWWNADGIAAYTWVTDGTPVIIKDIAPGRYMLVEVEVPDGYVTAADSVAMCQAMRLFRGSTLLATGCLIFVMPPPAI